MATGGPTSPVTTEGERQRRLPSAAVIQAYRPLSAWPSRGSGSGSGTRSRASAVSMAPIRE